MHNHVLTCDGISNVWMFDKAIKKSKRAKSRSMEPLLWDYGGFVLVVKRGCTMIVYMILRICDIKADCDGIFKEVGV